MLLILVAGVAGCSDQRQPGAPGSPAAASPSVADDPPGRLTCQNLAAAVRSASLMDPGVVDRIVAASGSADAPVADAATALGEAYRNARASHGTPNEPDAIAAVSAAAADMSQVCADSGLDSAD
ncbi:MULTISPECIES: hypothetical protein [unclassified Actinoplanes]|uniref:hypothetical protein n=1 Tax=unclassified Actinoplanes TaxID=2626549 RepID=UPI00030339B7|nr:MULTISPECIES: hypothetical protein [unclassified Actinoplanes]